VSDGSGAPNGSSTATLTLTVTAVNDAPVAVNDSATFNEDTVKNGNVIANDSDVDGDTLTVTQFVINGNTYAAGLTATLPQGTLTIGTNGDYTFTPAPNYNGPVPVATYTLTDGHVSTTATLTLAVTAVPDAPVANDDTASTTINTPITVDVLNNDTDGDGDTLTVSNPVLANPAQGTVSVDATGHLVFTPANNFSGAVQIQYTVTDPSGLSDTATLTVNVGTNTPPTGADAARTINEDTSYTVQAGDFGFADTDAGQTLINVRVDALPAAGTLLLNGSPVTAGQVISVAEINAGHLVFSPAANANGANYASFNFSVQDSAGSFDAAPNTLSFNVTPVADAAVITAGSGAVTEDTAVNGAGNLTTAGTLAIVDPDAGEAAFQPQASTAGTYGSFTLGTNGAWSYAAANNNPAIQALGAGQTLTETFTVRSVDGTPSTVVVTINGTNDAAVISAGTGSVTEDVGVVGGNLSTGGTLTVSDVDTGQATFQPQASTAGTYGSFTLGANGAWTYTAANNNATIQALGTGQTLTETFAVKSADGTSSSVVVTINGTNEEAEIYSATLN
jgi:VCBS repeat-containing protein